MTERTYRFAHLHGFSSSSGSRKGRDLARRLELLGLKLHLPELDVPSFGQQTFSRALSVLDELDTEPGPPWRLTGSSLGGYLAARWAELHPERVDRLVLLCPAFDLLGLWEQRQPGQFRRWQAEGELLLPDHAGRLAPLHWGFVEDGRRHPPWPEVPCPTLLIHGLRDETVPIENSRRYAAARPHVRLVELDDDHGLLDSLERIGREVADFFDLAQPPESPNRQP